MIEQAQERKGLGALPSFEQAWAAKEAAGYQYGAEALQGVRLGWDMRSEAEQGGPTGAPGARLVVGWKAFVDFCCAAGPERMRAALPHRRSYDFYAALLPELRLDHERGEPQALEAARRWGGLSDLRQRSVYPVLGKLYAAQVRKRAARYVPTSPLIFCLPGLDVQVEPHVTWAVGVDPALAVFIHFDSQKAGSRRVALTLALARVAGLDPAFLDLHAGTFGRPRDGRLGLAYLEAEAAAFLAMRAAAERRF